MCFKSVKLSTVLKTLGKSLLVSAIATGAVAFIGFVSTQVDKYIHRVELETDKMKELQSSFDAMQSELENIDKQIAEIQSRGPLTFTEKSELENLEKQRKELDASLIVQEGLTGAKARDLIDSADTLFEDQYKGKVPTQEGIDFAKQYALATGMMSIFEGADLDLLIGKYEAMTEEANKAYSEISTGQFDIYENAIEASEAFDTYSENAQYVADEIWIQAGAIEELIENYNKVPESSLSDVSKKYKAQLEETLSLIMKNLDPEKLNQIQFEKAFNSQSKAVQQGLINLSKTGFVTEEKLRSNFSGFVASCEEAGLSVEQLSEQLLALYANMQGKGNSNPVLSLATDASVGILTQFENINKAIGEKATVSDVQALIDLDSDYAACMELVNGQMQLNIEKSRKVAEAKAAEQIEIIKVSKAYEQANYNKNTEEIKRLKTQLEKCTDAFSDTRDEIEEQIRSLEKENSVIDTTIMQYDVLKGQLESACTAYAAWKAAQSAPTQGDMYTDVQSALDYVDKVLHDSTSDDYMKIGKANTKFWSALDLIMPTDGSIDTSDMQKVNKYINSVKTYLAKEGKAGLNSVIAQLKKYVGENGLKIFDQELLKKGLYKISEGVTLDDFAKALNVNKEVAQAVIGMMNMYGFDIQMEPIAEGVEDLTRAFNESRDALDKEAESLRVIVRASEGYNNYIDEQIKKQQKYKDALDGVNKAIEEYKTNNIPYENYGNVDNVNREGIYFDSENLSTYNKAAYQYGIKSGDWVSSLGYSQTLEGTEIEVAVTPVLQTDEGAVLLNKDQMADYLKKVVSGAAEDGEIKQGEILKLDAEGFDVEVNGQLVRVKNMIAGVEGDIVNDAELTKADIMAIAGSTEDEIKQVLGEDATSEYIGRSMHDIQEKTLDAKRAFAELAGEFSSNLTFQLFDISGLYDQEEIITKLTSNIENLKGYKLSDSFDTSQLEDVNSLLTYYILQKQEMERPFIMKIDSNAVNEDMRSLFEELQNYQEAVERLEVLEATSGIDSDEYKKAKKTVDETTESIKTLYTELDKNGKIGPELKLNFDENTTKEDLQGQLNNIVQNAVTDIDKADIVFGVNDDYIEQFKQKQSGDYKAGDIVYGCNHKEVDAFLSTLKDLEYEITYRIKADGAVSPYVAKPIAYSSPLTASGNGEVNGTIPDAGISRAYGTDGFDPIGLPVGEPAGGRMLVGELGTELLVSRKTGKWHTVGDNGAEFVQVERGDIIFNHEQTRQLLSRGWVNSRGLARAYGTAMASGNARVETPTAKTTVETSDYNLRSSVIDLENSFADVAKSAKATAKATKDAADAAKEQAAAEKEAEEALEKQRNHISSVVSAATRVLDQEIKRLEEARDLEKERLQVIIDENNVILERLEKENKDYEQGYSAINKFLQDQIDEIERWKDSHAEAADSIIEDNRKIQESYQDLQEKQNRGLSAVSALFSRQKEQLEEQREAQKKPLQEQIDALEKQAEALRKANDERSEEIELAKKKDALERARTQRTSRVYKEGQGFVWERDEAAYQTAQDDYDDALRTKQLNDQLDLIDQQKEALQDQMDAIDESIDNQIEHLDELAQAWEKAADKYSDYKDILAAQEIWGADWENFILNSSPEDADAFGQQYADNEWNIERYGNYIDWLEEQKEAGQKQFDEQIQQYQDLQTMWNNTKNMFQEWEDILSVSRILGENWRDVVLKSNEEVAKSYGQTFADIIWSMETYNNYNEELTKQQEEIDKKYEARIKQLEAQKELWQAIADAEQINADAAAALESLGSGWEQRVIAGDISLAQQFAQSNADLIGHVGVLEQADTSLYRASETLGNYSSGSVAAAQETSGAAEWMATATETANNRIIESDANAVQAAGDFYAQRIRDLQQYAEEHDARFEAMIASTERMAEAIRKLGLENGDMDTRPVEDAVDTVIQKTEQLNETAKEHKETVKENMDEADDRYTEHVEQLIELNDVIAESEQEHYDIRMEQLNAFNEMFSAASAQVISTAEKMAASLAASVASAAASLAQLQSMAGSAASISSEISAKTGMSSHAGGAYRIAGRTISALDEEGPEIVVRENRGRYAMLEVGDGVIKNNLTNTLLSTAINPNKMIGDRVADYMEKNSVRIERTETAGEQIHVDVGGITMSNVNDLDTFSRIIEENVGTVFAQATHRRR